MPNQIFLPITSTRNPRTNPPRVKFHMAYSRPVQSSRLCAAHPSLTSRERQLPLTCSIVSRHHHLGALLQVERSSDISSPEEELWSVVTEKGSVSSSLLLTQHIDLALEFFCRSDTLGRGQYLSPGNLITLSSPEESPNVVSSLSKVKKFLEHLNSSDSGGGIVVETHDINSITGVNLTLLNSPRHDSSAPRDGEDVFDRHQKGLLQVADWLDNVLVHSSHKLKDSSLPVSVLVTALSSRKSAAPNNGDFISIEIIKIEKLSEVVSLGFLMEEKGGRGIKSLTKMMTETLA